MVGLNVSYLLMLVWCVGGVLSAPLCLSGDFDSQLRHIMRTQVLSTQDPAHIISRVQDDLRATLSQRWQDFELIPFGSLTSGVDTIYSDLDIGFRLPNFNFTSSSFTVIEETTQLFQKQPEIYTYISGSHRSQFSRYSFLHIPTQRKVDLMFHLFNNGEEAIAATKLFKYYFNLDDRNVTLIRFLKYLFKIHGLTGSRFSVLVHNYKVYLLLMFYLQQINMAPPVYVLKKYSKSLLVNNWDVSFNEPSYSTMNNTENLHQLLGGFFKYYSEFNFDEYIVSPYTGRPLPRSAFIDVDKLPQEHFLNEYFNRTIQVEIKNNLKCTDLCIQDVFSLDTNKGLNNSHKKATKFKNFIKSVAKMFKDLPSDRILRTILLVDEQNETVIKLNNTAVVGVNEQNCIEVPDA